MTRQEKRLQLALKRLEPLIRRAFEQAVQDAAMSVDQRVLAALIEQGRIYEAVELLRIDQSLFAPLKDAIRGSYIEGGLLAEAIAPRGLAGVFRFDGYSAEAVAWVQEHVGGLIQTFQDDTVENTRRVIDAGLREGTHSSKVARSITGTGRLRTGGYLGLTTQQTDSIIAGRAKLASGDPKLMREYLNLKLRDRRFDAKIKRAIADGKAITGKDLDAIIAGHRSKALGYRGRVIAQQEARNAVDAGQYEGMRQMAARDDVEAVTKRWQHNLSQVPREDHVAMNGTVINFDEEFVFPDGTRMKHTHEGDAPAHHTIGCFAPWVKVARLGLKKAMRHEYIGDLVELSFGGNVSLTVTPNHPVLTGNGWVAAGEIAEGDNLFNCTVGDLPVSNPDHQVENVQSAAHEIYDAAKALRGSMRISRRVVDFHGHIPNQDVDVVSIPSSLGFALKPGAQDAIDNGFFSEADVSGGFFLAARMKYACAAQFSSSPARFMRGLRSAFSGLWARFCSRSPAALGIVRACQAKLVKATAHCGSACPDLFCYSQNGKAIIVQTPDVCVHGATHRESFVARGGALAATPRPIRRGDTNIGEAGPDDGDREASFSRDLRDAFRALSSLFYTRQVRPPLLSPHVDAAVVSGVRRFHYEGPVYNFESTSNVLVSNGIINHNCRCTTFYRVRYRVD